MVKKAIDECIKKGITDIMDILGELGTVPEYIRKRILSENSINKLKLWLKLAARTDSIESFESRM